MGHFTDLIEISVKWFIVWYWVTTLMIIISAGPPVSRLDLYIRKKCINLYIFRDHQYVDLHLFKFWFYLMMTILGTPRVRAFKLEYSDFFRVFKLKWSKFRAPGGPGENAQSTPVLPGPKGPRMLILNSIMVQSAKLFEISVDWATIWYQTP